MQNALLEIRDLIVDYDSAARTGRAVDGFSFAIRPGEALALVGESGCGKSTTALAIMGLLPDSCRRQGCIELAGRDLLSSSEDELEALRGKEIAMVFQEPMTSLNPVYTIGFQLREVLYQHEGLSRQAADSRVAELLKIVGLPDPARIADAYPHQLSGGQRQRAMIALAIACRPKLLVADEPTTALDVTVQRQILEVLDRLRRELGMALLLISHDLHLVSRWCDRAIVMHDGRMVEELEAGDLFETGTHPYTRGLIETSVRLDDPRHYTSSRLSEIRTSRDEAGAIRFDVSAPEINAAPALRAKRNVVLSAENIVVEYDTPTGKLKAVDDVSLKIQAGETLGLVGESGSGKSSLSRALINLIPIKSGRVRLNDRDLSSAKGEHLRKLRGDVQMVFQDPFASLNPRQTVGDILESVLKAHGVHERQRRSILVAEALDQVALPRHASNRYAHEFSGGQRQRIAIARAIILRPSLIICDEAVSSLDVSIQAQILNLLADLKEEFDLSYLFITHDLAVVNYFADRILVMKEGRLVDEGKPFTLWTQPNATYTRSLVTSLMG